MSSDFTDETKASAGPQNGQPGSKGHCPPSYPAWGPHLRSSSETGSPPMVSQSTPHRQMAGTFHSTRLHGGHTWSPGKTQRTEWGQASSRDRGVLICSTGVLSLEFCRETGGLNICISVIHHSQDCAKKYLGSIDHWVTKWGHTPAEETALPSESFHFEINIQPTGLLKTAQRSLCSS